MNEIAPTFADWYPDAATGGTKYWDGKRWTGDLRPRRKQFAAAAKPDDWGLFFLGLSFPALPLLAGIAPDESVEKPVLWILVGIVLLLAYVAFGIYRFRGQGPTTASIKKRMAAEEASAKGRRRSANMASVAERLIGRGRARSSPLRRFRRRPRPPQSTSMRSRVGRSRGLSRSSSTSCMQEQSPTPSTRRRKPSCWALIRPMTPSPR